MNQRFWSVRMFAALWGILFAPLAPALAGEREVVELLPADTLAYAGWSELLEEGEGSLLDVIQAVLARLAPDVDDVESIGRVIEFAREAMMRSGGVALIECGGGDEGSFAPGVLAVVDAGGEAGLFDQAFTKIVEMLEGGDVATLSLGDWTLHTAGGGAEFKFAWGHREGNFVLAGGADPAAVLRANVLNRGKPLASNPVFRACRDKLGGKQAAEFSVFANGDRLLDLLKLGLAASGVEMLPVHEKILKESGLTDLHALYAEIEDSELGSRTRIFVNTGGSRKGILKAWDNQPLTDDTLRMIPKDATAAIASKLDLHAMWEETRRAIEEVDPNTALQIDSGLAGISAMLGFSITDQVLPAFGDTWVIFDAPDHGGFLLSGLVLVAEVRDREALAGALERTMMMLAPLAAQGRMQPTSGMMERDGHTIHYLVLAGWPSPIAPAACFIDDHVVLGLLPQTVAVAAKQVDPKTRKGSILDHPDVKAARAKLPKGMQSFVFSDNDAVERASYGLGTLAATMLCSAAAPDVADPGMLPTLPEALAEVRCGVGSTIADEDGILYTSYNNVAPLGLLGNQAATVASIALLISILLPSLSRARALAKRAVSAANLRGIGHAMHIYANDHQESYPPDFDALIAEGMITRDMLVSPLDDEAGVSYVYISGQRDSSDWRSILAYERIHSDEGTNVLFLDGHVEWLRLPDFKRRLLETYKRLGREDEMPADLRP